MVVRPSSLDVIARARDPRIQLGYEYWLSKVLHREQIPGRQDLDPGEMVEFLPCVVLFDVERHGARLRFRHRLTGTHFFDLFGREVTDLYIEEAGSREDMAVVATRFEGVVRTRQPVYGVSPVPVTGREFLKYEHLTMPLASDGVMVDMLFGIRCALREPRRGAA